mmetsp:Transcript_127924/g.232877  ORF Transcript_127924/g.232877 Transcript_127924/m.232877 type:complete len:128 (+) Transcript_127924:3-386(+)
MFWCCIIYSLNRIANSFLICFLKRFTEHQRRRQASVCTQMQGDAGSLGSGDAHRLDSSEPALVDTLLPDLLREILCLAATRAAPARLGAVRGRSPESSERARPCVTESRWSKCMAMPLNSSTLRPRD